MKLWCPRQESNLYHSLRRGEFYPLNYGGSGEDCRLGNLKGLSRIQAKRLLMGIWIELGIFGLVFVFAWHQMRDLKKERLKSEKQQAQAADQAKE